MPENNGNASNEKHDKIVRQLEYYFGDINLNRDKFLKEQLAKNDGWVALETLMTFNKMKSLAADVDEVYDAVKQCESSLLKLDDDQKRIKRSEDCPLPEINEEYKKALNLRTVHLKGFPKESTMEELRSYAEKFGTVDSVFMRRHKDKSFKGCIHAVFKTLDEANAAIASDEKFGDSVLLRENLVDGLKRKEEYRQNRRKKSKESKKGGGGGDDEDEEMDKEIKYDKGVVLKLIDIPDTLNYRAIKDSFADKMDSTDKLPYVNIENNDAFVKFYKVESLKKAVRLLNGKENVDKVTGDDKEAKSDDVKAEDAEKSDDVRTEDAEKSEKEAEKSNETEPEPTELVIADKTLKFEILSGEAEEEYWRKNQAAFELQRQNKSASRKQNKSRGRGYKGKFDGYKGQKRAGGRQGRDEERGSKRVKSE